MPKSITIMVPAYNEELYLAKTVSAIVESVKPYFTDYEIIIFDDCSKDKTAQVADALASKNTNIRVIHNKKNQGLGWNYRQGIKLAKKEYYCWIPGDQGNDKIVIKSFKEIFKSVGQADLITVYTQFKTPRPFYRKIFSKSFTLLLNCLFGLSLHYYMGISVYKTKDLRKIHIKSTSFTMNAEALIKFLKKGKTLKEIPFYLNRDYGNSTLFRPKNVGRIIGAVGRIFFEVYIKRKT